MKTRIRYTTACGETDTFILERPQAVVSVEVVKEERRIGSCSLGRLGRAFSKMDSNMLVIIKDEDGDIVINTCGVDDHIWEKLLEACGETDTFILERPQAVVSVEVVKEPELKRGTMITNSGRTVIGGLASGYYFEQQKGCGGDLVYLYDSDDNKVFCYYKSGGIKDSEVS